MGDEKVAHYKDPWRERGSPRELRALMETVVEIKVEVDTTMEGMIKMETKEEPTKAIKQEAIEESPSQELETNEGIEGDQC